MVRQLLCVVDRFVFRRCIVRRESSPVTTVVFLLATVPLMFTQDSQTQPQPTLPPDILGPQLIAWSQLQKPQPVPQPLPPPDGHVQQPDQQPATSSAQEDLRPVPSTFQGTIVKKGASYVLRATSNETYQLDDQDRARQYEGKQIKIVGTLDVNGRSLHVTSIELIS